MQQLCCCYLRIHGQTDRQTNRHGGAEMCHIEAFRQSTVHQRQTPTTVLFSWCSTVEILSLIYRDKTRRQTARRHLLDTHSLTFYFVQEAHSAMSITQCYLRLNARHLSLFDRNKFLASALLVFNYSSCHNISIYFIL